MHTHRSLHNWGWLRLNEKLLVVSSAQFPRSVNIIACRSSKFLQVHGKSQRTYLAGHVRWPLILLLYGVSRAVLFEIKTSTPRAMAQSSPRGSEAEVKSGDSPVISRGEEGRGNTNERSANHLFSRLVQTSSMPFLSHSDAKLRPDLSQLTSDIFQRLFN